MSYEKTGFTEREGGMKSSALFVTGLAIGFAIALGAGSGLADEGGKEEKGRMEHERMGSMMERMMGPMAGGREGHRRISLSPSELKEALKLSPEQVEALKPIETDYRKATITKQAAVRVAEVELAALLDHKKPDRTALQQKIKEIGALQADLMLYRVESLLKLREVLSEEQHEKFKALLRQRMEGFGRGGAMHGMGGMMR